MRIRNSDFASADACGLWLNKERYHTIETSVGLYSMTRYEFSQRLARWRCSDHDAIPPLVFCRGSEQGSGTNRQMARRVLRTIGS
jgi:hypothetical protein